MIWLATESSTTWLPGFRPELLPVQAGDKIRFISKGGLAGIEIDGVVGSLPLTNGDTLHIKPKVGDINFLRMLLTCEGLYSDFRKNIQDSVAYQAKEETSIISLVARQFVQELARIQANSLRFKRNPTTARNDFVSGTVLPLRTQLNIRRRSARPVECLVKERSFDTVENRVLGSAASRAIIHLPTTNPSDTRVAKEWAYRFNSTRIYDDLQAVNQMLLSGKFAGSRGYYVKALVLAKILLGESGISQGLSEEIAGDAILVNTATLFEQYLLAVLASSFQKKGLIVRKGGNPPEYLYTDGTFKMTPDVCILAGTKYILIGDAKYKQPDAKDHYQLSCYVKAYGLSTGVIFKPAFDTKEPTIIKRTTHDGATIIELSLPLSDLNLTEQTLGQLDRVVSFH